MKRKQVFDSRTDSINDTSLSKYIFMKGRWQCDLCWTVGPNEIEEYEFEPKKKILLGDFLSYISEQVSELVPEDSLHTYFKIYLTKN